MYKASKFSQFSRQISKSFLYIFQRPHKYISNSLDNARVTTLANDNLTQDDALKHRYEVLENTYSTEYIHYNDFISLGFKSTAQILAREISLDFAIFFYLDLRTETGLTARAYMRQLPQLGGETKVVIIGALEHMLTQAKKKLVSASNVALYIGDVTALPPVIL